MTVDSVEFSEQTEIQAKTPEKSAASSHKTPKTCPLFQVRPYQ